MNATTKTETETALRPGIYVRNGSAWTPAPGWVRDLALGPLRFAYARVSTQDQNLEGQAERLAANADVLFCDKASGLKARRPYFDRVLELLGEGDALVATKLDRFGRSVVNLGEVAALINGRGADLVALDADIDTRNPFGKLVFWILAAIAEFERELIVSRTRDGQDSVRRAGNLRRSNGGHVPLLGFRESDGDDWATDLDVAKVLRDMAARLLRGEVLEDAFAEQPAIYDATGREVSARNVAAALRRPATAGLITARDGSIFGPSGIESPPLDLPTFYALADLFDGRKTGRQISGQFPYGKLLACDNCGNQLSGGRSYWPKGSKTPIYQCKNPHPATGHDRPCKGVSIVAADLHAVVRAGVEGWAATSPEFAAAAGRQAELTGRQAELESRLAKIRDRIADWSDQLDSGDVTEDRYDAAMSRLRAERRAISAEISALADVIAHPVPAEIDWDAMTDDEQRRLIAKAFQTPIRVRPGRGGARPLPADQRVILEPRERKATAA